MSNLKKSKEILEKLFLKDYNVQGIYIESVREKLSRFVVLRKLEDQNQNPIYEAVEIDLTFKKYTVVKRSGEKIVHEVSPFICQITESNYIPHKVQNVRIATLVNEYLDNTDILNEIFSTASFSTENTIHTYSIYSIDYNHELNLGPGLCVFKTAGEDAPNLLINDKLKHSMAVGYL